MKIENINDIEYLIDNNRNKINLKKYSESEAIKMLESLVDCYNCTDSKNCDSCYNCIDCDDCYNCTDSVNCRDCYNVSRSDNCVYCVNCDECNNSYNLNNCSYINDGLNEFGIKGK